MRHALPAVAVFLFAPLSALAHGEAIVNEAYETTAATYACASSASLNVRYLNMKDGPSFAVLTIRGEIVLLETAESASGARYVSVDPATPYQWWTKGDEAALDLLGPDGSVQASILSDCRDGH